MLGSISCFPRVKSTWWKRTESPSGGLVSILTSTSQLPPLVGHSVQAHAVQPNFVQTHGDLQRPQISLYKIMNRTSRIFQFDGIVQP